MLARWRTRWRPWRNLLRRRLGLGRFGRRGLDARLAETRDDLAAALARLYPGVSSREEGARPASFHDHESRLFSQNGEDGLLLHIFATIGTTDRRIVEFGVEDGRECLARALVTHFGWSALLMDADGRNVGEARRLYRDDCGLDDGRVRIERCFVTAENIDDTLRRFGMEGDIDLLSVDIDGNDYWVWKAIEGVRPRVVVVEYNASFGPDEKAAVVYDASFDRKAAHPSGWYHGASLAALRDLGDRKGYALVGCDSSGVNAFFVRRDVLAPPLAEVAAAEAWRPHRRRSARATDAEQRSLLLALPLVRDP